MKLSVGHKLYFGFGVVLFLLTMMGAFAYSQVNSTKNTYEDLLNDRVQKINIVRDLIRISKDIQLANRGYLLIGDEKSLASYQESKKNYTKLYQELEAMLNRETGKKLLQELGQYSDQYIQLAEETIALKKRNDPSYIDTLTTKGLPLVNGFGKKAEEMIQYQTESLNQVREDSIAKVKDIQRNLMLLSIIAIMLGIGFAYFISRLISKPITSMAAVAAKIASGDLTQEKIQVITKDEIANLAHAFNDMSENLRQVIHQIHTSSEQVAAASEELLATTEQATQATNQISCAIQDVASGAETQVSSSRESSKAMEEVSLGIQQIAESSATVSDSAQLATSHSMHGNEFIQRAIQQMNSIETGTENTTAAIMKLHERSQEIGKIIEVITGIADQTNLLALNAAIESARAGEHGRGFAVVADEVKKLAEQSRASAKQITDLISEIQADTEMANKQIHHSTKEVLLGKTIIQQTGEAFQQISLAVEHVNEQIQEVSAASEQISANSQQVTASVDQLAQIAVKASEGSQNVAASSEEQFASMQEITSSAESLTQLAQDLQVLIAKFKI